MCRPPCPPPLHVTGARIWTGAAERRWARSITFEDGRVTALDEAAPRGAVVVEAAGPVAVPGLIDAHLHLLQGGLSLRQLDLSGARSREAFEAAVARRHAELEPGAWLIGHGWSEENWGGAPAPEKSWLAAAADRPAVCYRMDMHAALVNDAVLARCPRAPGGEWACGEGGRVVRDDRGEPNGLMLEAAAWELINPLLPDPTPHEKQAALAAACAHARQRGLTAVGSMEYARDVEAAYVPRRHGLGLRCRITLLDRGWPMRFDRGAAFPGDEYLAIIGYKTFLDGTLGSRTARMLEDYADDPGNRGLFVELAAAGDLPAWAAGVVEAGLSPSMHAIGDEALRLALDVVHGLPESARPRIEHCQQIDPADLGRFAGVVASMQPLHKADDGRFAGRRLGPRRLRGTFAFRDLLGAGARLAFGSDWPVVTCDPLAGIRAAVTGRTTEGVLFLPQQNLTVAEALHAYTAGSARALGLDEAGRLAAGAAGDMVILDRDPFTADWEDTPPAVLTTIVGGAVAYDASRSPG